MERVGGDEPSEIARLIERAKAGEAGAVGELFARHRDRLRRMVEMRLDHRLQAKVDPSDVIQDAYAEVVVRLAEYLADPKLPLFLWLRLVVGERLMKTHRHHLGTHLRDVTREVSLYRGRAARGQFTGSCCPAPRQTHLPDPGRSARRAVTPTSECDQRPRSDRSRNPLPTSL